MDSWKSLALELVASMKDSGAKLVAQPYDRVADLEIADRAAEKKSVQDSLLLQRNLSCPLLGEPVAPCRGDGCRFWNEEHDGCGLMVAANLILNCLARR